MKQCGIYILTGFNKKVLYVGVTSDLVKRIYEHKNKLADGFSKRYNLNCLVYYECFDSIVDAIAREKQLKNGSRAKKEALINGFNPSWRDLYEDIVG